MKIDRNNIINKLLLKKLCYNKNLYEYISSIDEDIRKMFIENVEKYIKNNNINIEINTNTKSSTNDIITYNLNDVIISNNDIDDNEIKTLYRKIVKITHPDVNNDSIMQNIYIKTNNFYKNKDIFGLYCICDFLNINVELTKNDIYKIKIEIKNLKDKIKMIKNSIYWKWYMCKNKNKMKYIIKYINMLNTTKNKKIKTILI